MTLEETKKIAFGKRKSTSYRQLTNCNNFMTKLKFRFMVQIARAWNDFSVANLEKVEKIKERRLLLGFLKMN